MVDFTNIKGHDNEGQLKNNQKRPEKKPEKTPYPEKSEIEEMLQDKLDEAMWNSRPPFKETNAEYDFSLSPLELQLITLNEYLIMLEDFIEDIIEDGIKDLDLDVAEAEDYVAVREKRLEEAFTHIGSIRLAMHKTIEIELRHYFSVAELMQLSRNQQDRGR